MVKPFSAQLNMPYEHRVPVANDHTNMVKFSDDEDATYQTAIRYLTEWVHDVDQASSML
jgi:hypothetical protein